MRRPWYDELSATFGWTHDQLQHELRLFNGLLVRRDSPKCLTGRTIRSWDASTTTRPTRRSAEFLLAFCRAQIAHRQDEESYDRIVKFLSDRVAVLTPDAAPVVDALSMAAGFALPHSHQDEHAYQSDIGFHRLSRFHLTRKQIVCDLVQITSRNGMHCKLVNSDGAIYRGPVLRNQSVVQFILVDAEPERETHKYSTRFMMFEAPTKEYASTISGIVLRLRNSNFSPIASIATLQKLPGLSAPGDFEDSTSGWSISTGYKTQLMSENLIGPLPANHPDFAEVELRLRGRTGFVSPITIPYR